MCMCYSIYIIKKGDVIPTWQVRKWSSQELSNLPNIVQIENKKTEIWIEGAQNMPPPKMPLWHMASFELKALDKQQMQEGLSDYLLST